MMRHFRIKTIGSHLWIEAVVANLDQFVVMVRILESSELVECYTCHEAGIDRPLQPFHVGHGGSGFKKWVTQD